jgi:uncharacterized damage-inducible protein DinB
MSELKHLIEELELIQNGDAWHGPGLGKLLDGVTAIQAAKKTGPDLHSIWELVLHIAVWENVFRERLEGQKKAEPDEGDFPPVTNMDNQAWIEALKFLDEAHKRLIQSVTRLSESDLVKRVPGKDFDVAFMLHGIVRHNVYHAGQIGLLKRILAEA